MTPRTGHPFHMYDAILAEPEAFWEAIHCNAESMTKLAQAVTGCRRLFLVGIGTSHHAALIGQHLLAAYAPGVDVRAVHAFDFALYGTALDAADGVIGISHRGTKRYTAESLERACAAGCMTALITGQGAGPRPRVHSMLATVEQEQSSAHTVSYVAAIAVLASLALEVGRQHRQAGRVSVPMPPVRHLVDDVPEALRAALASEAHVMRWAREHAGARRIWLVGGGPAAVTAQEIALKIKETSYLQAEGMSVEAMLHGPFQCTSPEDLFVFIAPADASQTRVLELRSMVQAIGASCLTISDCAAPAGVEDAGWLTVPAVAHPLSALTCLVPLQLFTYHLSLVVGTNPDGFRLEDPRFARAQALVRL